MMKNWMLVVLVGLLIGAWPAMAQETTDSSIGVRGVLVDGQSYEGDLTAENSMHLYAFQGSSGASVTLSMSQTGGTLDPFLVLLGSDGHTLAWDDDSAGNLNASLSASLPDNGVYFVLASTLYSLYENAESDEVDGSYELQITGATDPGGELALDANTLGLSNLTLDTPSNGAIDENFPVALAVLTVQDSITVDVNATSTEIDPLVYVFDVDGQRIGIDDDSMDGRNALISTLPLDEPGQYLVVVSTFDFHKVNDYGLTGGAFTLTVFRSA
jgi:hypothetical protein